MRGRNREREERGGERRERRRSNMVSVYRFLCFALIRKVIRQRQMEIFHNVEEIDPLWDILQLEEKALEDRVGKY